VLFVIVGRNEPLYEAEFNKRPGSGDAVTRQNYFVLHSALDLVEKAAWTTSNMYLKVVDKVSTTHLRLKRQRILSLISNFRAQF
jgi:trafficking protein particle complex subunit 2